MGWLIWLAFGLAVGYLVGRHRCRNDETKRIEIDRDSRYMGR